MWSFPLRGSIALVIMGQEVETYKWTNCRYRMQQRRTSDVGSASEMRGEE